MTSAFNRLSIRVPIAIRLFLAILLTAVTITVMGLWVLHLAMQDGFASYVTQIEANKLDGFVTQLQQDYQKEGRWPDSSDQYRGEWLKHRYEAYLFSTIHGSKGHAFDRMPSEMKAGMQDMPQPNMQIHSPFKDQFDHSKPPFDKPMEMPFLGMSHSERSFRLAPPRFEPDRLDVGSRLGLLDAHGTLLSGLAASSGSPKLVLRSQQQIIGYLTLNPGIDPKDALSTDFFARQKQQILWIGVGCLLLSAIVAGLLARHFRKPIKRLMTSAEHLIQGEFSFRNYIRRSDELGELGHKMNQLADILSQHESSRRQWVADTSHELRTPVSVLRAQIEAIQDGVREATPQHLQLMHRQVLSLSRLLNDVYDLARADVGQLACEHRQMMPWQILRAESEAFSEPMQQQGLRLEVIEPETQPQVMGDPDRIRQIIVNLLENSRRYTNAGGTVRLSSELQVLQKGTFWTLYVDDSLPSVSDAVLTHLGERFFRADSSRTRETGGSGLGLALSCQVAAIHGGVLLFEHSPLGGLRAILRLPVVQNDQTT